MKDKLFTPSYCYIIVANFLLYFGFWLLTPVLVFYLTETFNSDTATAGLIISCYTVSALCMRPFSGYLLDNFARKPLYLIAYFLFLSVFVGYILAGYLFIFALLRVVHGMAFGVSTVGGNTIVIDIMPSSRRGEGLGYYGLSNNMAMAVGPMVGLFLHNQHVSYPVIFGCGLFASVVGFVFALSVKTPAKPKVKREPLSLDRFLLLKGIPAGIALLLLSVPYGMTTNYVAMYAQRIGITAETGFFFTLMAFGMAVSRIFSGKLVDKGYICEIIQWGFVGVIACFFMLASCAWLAQWNMTVCTGVFFLVPVVLGVGFGVMFPAYNTVFVNLAENNQRGTATSTYLTSWDIGLGIGIVFGGKIADLMNFQTAYFLGACLTIVSAIYFKYKVTPHFAENRLR